jgi:hypothetical protein
MVNETTTTDDPRLRALETALAADDDAAIRSQYADALTLAFQSEALAGRVLARTIGDLQAVHEWFSVQSAELQRTNSEIRARIEGGLGEANDFRTTHERLSAAVAALRG